MPAQYRVSCGLHLKISFILHKCVASSKMSTALFTWLEKCALHEVIEFTPGETRAADKTPFRCWFYENCVRGMAHSDFQIFSKAVIIKKLFFCILYELGLENGSHLVSASACPGNFRCQVLYSHSCVFVLCIAKRQNSPLSASLNHNINAPSGSYVLDYEFFLKHSLIIPKCFDLDSLSQGLHFNERALYLGLRSRRRTTGLFAEAAHFFRR